MPSTYTDRGRIILQATGENDGTWGALTNDSAIKLIDEMVDGVTTKDISGSGSVSLTVNNGATDESRKKILKLTGTLTGNRTVVVPSVEKLYIVDASGVTHGSFTLTIKTSGGAGVVFDGVDYDKGVIYCDGTDVYGIVDNEKFDPNTLGDLALLDTVDTAQIDNGAITTAKLEDGAVTANKLVSGLLLSAVPSGAIFWFGASTAPTGYLTCDGTAVSRTTYAALFSVVGSTFGVGDGSTTFNLPNLTTNNRFIRAADGVTISVGTTQTDSIQNLTGSFTGASISDGGGTVLSGASGVFKQSSTGGSRRATANSYTNGPSELVEINTNSNTNGGIRFGTETRPTNIALLPCIKT